MKTEKSNNRASNFFKTTLIGGLVVLLPLAIFYVLVSFLFYTATGIVKPLLGLGKLSADFPYPFLVDVFAFVFLILLLFLVGLLVSTAPGQKWVNRIEHVILFKLPYYGTVREAVHQLLGNSNMNLFRVVLVDLYNTGTLATGFLTDETAGEYCTVFIPTGPNPTNGFVYHVKRDQIKFIDIGTEEAIRSIIGVGTGSTAILEKHFKYEQKANFSDGVSTGFDQPETDVLDSSGESNRIEQSQVL